MRLNLYHATSREAADSIQREGRFRPGKHGFAGPAIYFSTVEAAACRKFHTSVKRWITIFVSCLAISGDP